MDDSLGDDLSVDVVVDEPAVGGGDEEGGVVDVPQCSRGGLVGVFLSGDDGGEVGLPGDAFDCSLIAHCIGGVEDGLEVIDLHPSRSLRFVLILQQQKPLGSVIELHLLQLILEAHVLDGLAALHVEDLLVGGGTSRDPSLEQAMRCCELISTSSDRTEARVS